MTGAQKNASVTTHTPYGHVFLYNNDSLCVLHHPDYLTGYSHERKMALWTAFTLTKNQVSSLKL